MHSPAFQKVFAMGVVTVTATMKLDVKDRGNINQRSPTTHSLLTKRSPVNLKKLPLKFKQATLTLFGPKALKSAPLLLKKGSLPLQKVLKTLPLALKKGPLPLKKTLKAVPLALKKGFSPVKKVFAKVPAVGAKVLGGCLLLASVIACTG